MLSLVDTILNNTSLPNLHPALVHFPIALFPLAVAFDLATLAGRSRFLDRVTAVLYALAALSAWATVWAGEAAEHALTGAPDYLRPEIEAHGDWAQRFLVAAAVVAVVRLALVWWRRGAERVDLLALRGLVVAVALGACLLLVGAADRGGSLVYRSGVAVMAVSMDGAGHRAAGTLIVANKAEATVSLVDVASGEVNATLPTGVGPHEVAVSPDGRRAVIANYGTGEAPGGTLTLVDVAAAKVLSTIDLGEYRRPHGMAWPTKEALFVTAEAQKSLLRVDPGAGKVVRAYVTGQEISHMVVVTPDLSRAFVSNIGSGTVTVLDLASGEKLADVATGQGSEGIAMTPDGSRVWVTNREADTVSLIDARSLEVIETLSLGSFPIRAEVTPDGGRVLVSSARSGSVAVIDQESAEVIKVIPIEVTAEVPSEEEAEGETERLLRFGDSPVPIGIEIAPGGDRAYVALANADQIVVLDLDTEEVSGQVTAGREPDGMGYSKVSVGK